VPVGLVAPADGVVGDPVDDAVAEAVGDSDPDGEAVSLPLGDGVGDVRGFDACPPKEVRGVSVVEPPVYVETARPLTSSKPTMTTIATRKTPVAATATRFQGSLDNVSRRDGRAAFSASASCCSDSSWVARGSCP